MLIFSAYWVLNDLLVFAANDLFAADLVAISSIFRSWIANGTDRAGDIRPERLLASLRRIAPLGVHSVSQRSILPANLGVAKDRASILG